MDQLINGVWTIDYMGKKFLPQNASAHTFF